MKLTKRYKGKTDAVSEVEIYSSCEDVYFQTNDWDGRKSIYKCVIPPQKYIFLINKIICMLEKISGVKYGLFVIRHKDDKWKKL